MGLHCDVRVQVVQGTIGLLTAIPATLVHALNLFVSSAGSLVLLGTGNRNERIDLMSKLLRQYTVSHAEGEKHARVPASDPTSMVSCCNAWDPSS